MKIGFFYLTYEWTQCSTHIDSCLIGFGLTFIKILFSTLNIRLKSRLCHSQQLVEALHGESHISSILTRKCNDNDRICATFLVHNPWNRANRGHSIVLEILACRETVHADGTNSETRWGLRMKKKTFPAIAGRPSGEIFSDGNFKFPDEQKRKQLFFLCSMSPKKGWQEGSNGFIGEVNLLEKRWNY